MRIDWRRHRRAVTVAERRVNLVDVGSGPPVLLLHGLGGNWQSWLCNIPALARDLRVIAPDLPGFGDSERPAAAIGIGAYADWAAELLDELDVPRACVVGNSMGGQIAAELAIRHGDRVARLVLVDAAGISSEALRNQRATMLLQRADRLLAFWSERVVGAGSRLTMRRRARRALLRLWFADPRDVPTALVIELAKGSGRAAFREALAGVTSHVMRERLHLISAPTLILWGAGDRITPARDADAFHRSIAGSRVVVWPRTGHLAMIERAAELNELVAEFAIAETARSSG